MTVVDSVSRTCKYQCLNSNVCSQSVADCTTNGRVASQVVLRQVLYMQPARHTVSITAGISQDADCIDYSCDNIICGIKNRLSSDYQYDLFCATTTTKASAVLHYNNNNNNNYYYYYYYCYTYLLFSNFLLTRSLAYN